MDVAGAAYNNMALGFGNGPNWRGHEKPNTGDGLRVDCLMPLILSERL